jgi:SAM-dependent methyltransferase
MKSQDWDERYRSHDLVWGKEPNQFVRQQCEHLPVGYALDLACGEGRNSLWLAQLGWRVHGQDFSPVAIERARQLTEAEHPLVRERISWEVADLTTTTLPANRFDLVLISYVHLAAEHWGQLLTGAARAVRPGGRVLVVGHDRRNITEGVGGPQDATLLTTPEEVANALRMEGMTIEIAHTVPRQTPEGTALDTLVLAMRPDDSVGSGSLG